jgi:hypothetical protein
LNMEGFGSGDKYLRRAVIFNLTLPFHSTFKMHRNYLLRGEATLNSEAKAMAR